MIDVLTAVLERSLDHALANMPRVIHTLSTVITPARMANNDGTCLKGARLAALTLCDSASAQSLTWAR